MGGERVFSSHSSRMEGGTVGTLSGDVSRGFIFSTGRGRTAPPPGKLSKIGGGRVLSSCSSKMCGGMVGTLIGEVSSIAGLLSS